MRYCCESYSSKIKKNNNNTTLNQGGNRQSIWEELKEESDWGGIPDLIQFISISQIRVYLYSPLNSPKGDQSASQWKTTT